MTERFMKHRIAATTPDGRTVWFGADDRWIGDPDRAELIEDEAHADIRLLDAEYLATGLTSVRLVDAGRVTHMA